MGELMTMLVLASLAGLAIPAGALLARVPLLGPQWLQTEFRHSVIAFGGGALLAAVALVLVPEGSKGLSIPLTVATMLGGGVFFCILDALLARTKGAVSQLVAMLADFVPEALALGAMFAAGASGAVLLALLIALQNLPEGFNAYREMTGVDQPRHEHRRRSAQGLPGARVLVLFALLVPLGPLAGVVGHLWLADVPAVLAGIMLFAAGGILYLVFQDIAPQARLDKHWVPTLGAVLGFLLGLVGHMLVH
ncbi:ZIP family metal transporter [Marinobacter sp. X15-166B]|uniref:ZIP family metal transporter n=1 Tax=Marinobacter sp. X15-166B TaxID=1897620 RepID=UPI00085C56D3|nr:divalent cation transporter [Marinobacter sp. X15-166B]OEY65321.1 divalent cation transporter [Marinobacter sp. X15-166B]